MSGPEMVTTWRPVDTGERMVAVAERAALGTTARVAVWPPGELGVACRATDRVLDALDRQASRFRDDSELTRLHRWGGGLVRLSEGLAEAIGVALAAARWTGGLVDPTIGEALIRLGYDRDFAAIDVTGSGEGDAMVAAATGPGWRTVWMDGRMIDLPAGVRLDLGATAKGLGSDRAVRAAMAAMGGAGGVLVSLGGDIAVGGTPPAGGWPVLVADRPQDVVSASTQVVRLCAGGVATSSIACRRWRRGDRTVHHIVDPRTGRPADGPWRTATVAAATCAEANAAATAAIVAGGDAEEWLARAGVPARLVSHRGEVRRVGGWPGSDGEPVVVGARGHLDGTARGVGVPPSVAARRGAVR